MPGSLYPTGCIHKSSWGKNLNFTEVVFRFLLVKQLIDNGSDQYTNEVLKISHSSTFKVTKNV